MSRIVSVNAPESIATSYGYDKAGNLTRTTDPRGNQTWRTYQPWNLLEDEIEPSTTAHPGLTDRTYTSVYDAAGNATEMRLPGGVVRTRLYDGLNRMTEESGSGGGASAASRTLARDRAGRLTSASHPSGTLTYTYDDRGLTVSAAGPAGAATFGYDVRGQLTTRTDPAGSHSFTYSARGELASAADGISGTTAAYTRDPDGLLLEASYPTGTTLQQTYDDAGRVTDQSLKNPAGLQRARQAYTYDADDRLTSQLIDLASNTATGTHTYSHDTANRLTAWTSPAGITTSYTYDTAGNRTLAGSTSYTYDQRNRLESNSAGQTYTWTPRGTLNDITTPGSSFRSPRHPPSPRPRSTPSTD